MEHLHKMRSFDERIIRYEKLYKRRLSWLMTICLASACFNILSGRPFFIYLATFELLTFLPFLPNRQLFQKELQVENIEIIG
ncbi:MAG: hypothetical protein JST68_17205 [Bacteroidetes bacterium]|nr:hypothetical protein [Bacteroidota bacterium]